jgi:hypothetical protein
MEKPPTESRSIVVKHVRGKVEKIQHPMLIQKSDMKEHLEVQRNHGVDQEPEQDSRADTPPCQDSLARVVQGEKLDRLPNSPLGVAVP